MVRALGRLGVRFYYYCHTTLQERNTNDSKFNLELEALSSFQYRTSSKHSGTFQCLEPCRVAILNEWWNTKCRVFGFPYPMCKEKKLDARYTSALFQDLQLGDRCFRKKYSICTSFFLLHISGKIMYYQCFCLAEISLSSPRNLFIFWWLNK